ncbi:leucine rich repeat LRR-containing protein [Nitzschia inconspicua]|uniref:Leucine rich repeat LRR-containing protein n=1 Tax=Nitzschia inconspicua TaxID=303405 RepID=A0A9K3L8F6_9STRA|nr:leucine rich repeat LRR-containing protein [Nitzschia inconspicua]
MLEAIETKSLNKTAAIVNNSSGRKRYNSGGDIDDITSSPLTVNTGISTPPTHHVYMATPGGTPNTAKTELTADTTSILPPPPDSGALTESSVSSTANSFISEQLHPNPLSHHNPPIQGFGYPSVVSMSQQQQKFQQSQSLSDEFPVTRPSRESVLQRLSEALLRRSLQKIDLSQRGLQPSDAKLVKMALLQNANLTEMKLGYNNLGDVGVKTLAVGIATHRALALLDLGFNNIGDEGMRALAGGLIKTQQHKNGGGTLQTLYLAGNLIGEDGALAIADCIRQGNGQLQKLFLTGNKIGGDGVKAITDAIVEDELRRQVTNVFLGSSQEPAIDEEDLVVCNDRNSQFDTAAETAVESIKSLVVSSEVNKHISYRGTFRGMQELFLGGTGMGPTGCSAIARLLAKSSSLRILSLPNCDIGDEELAFLARSLKDNKDSLPIESIQLSFNRITHKGLEMLTNALWGSSTLKDLEVDNNEIGDRGAHHIAAIIPGMKALENLDVGFNSIKLTGLNVLMKTIAESQFLQSLSVSGNAVDVNAAKAIAFAMAYNCSLKAIHLVHCSIDHDGQRHITAGIVSNSRTSLRKLTGFEIGSAIVTLGFPEALKYWTNEQILNFIDLMWYNKGDGGDAANGDTTPPVAMERDLDPLSFLPGQDGFMRESHQQSGPLEATVVVEVAKKAFETLVANGVDVFSRRPSSNFDPSFGSPLASGTIMVESSSATTGNPTLYLNAQATNGSNGGMDEMNVQMQSFVAAPESSDAKKQEMPDPARKKRIVEWLCSNIRHLNELAQIPFDSRELWKLHQHYFTPVVNESGGIGWQGMDDALGFSSVPNVTYSYQGGSAVTTSSGSVEQQMLVPMSDPVLPGQAHASIPILKRKVSYRCLGDVTQTSLQPPHLESPSLRKGANPAASVAKIIEHGHTGNSLPPKNKRARRNRSRISFLPRTKAKLDSYLDVCHEKALITMRQLYYVERAILAGKVNALDSDAGCRTHLSGVLASEAEMIIVDML